MLISLIAAMDRNRVIGNKNALPWHLPADFAHFKALTKGKPIIMGSTTFASIGKPLPERKNIVLNRDKGYAPEGIIVARSIPEALTEAAGAEEVMICGGASVYGQFLPLAHRMYLTMIDAEVEGNAQFPAWSPNEWREVSREAHPADEKNEYRYSFVRLERVG
ncbi:MAG: type 3 dihydrofolate reductase [Candidatus Sungbacteria bacterium]|nr:type 3 dihydrofolate reductase [Candidatus Sungbacteria bacterium]